MERKIYIPEICVIFWACGHIGQRKVKFSQLKQLKGLLARVLMNENHYHYHIIYTYDGILNAEKYFSIENGVITSRHNDDYNEKFKQYKEKIIELIKEALGIEFLQSAEIIESTKITWKQSLKEI